MTSLYLNADHTFVLWLRHPWTPIWRRRRFSVHAFSSITHHSGMTSFTQQVFKFFHDPESSIISFLFHQVQHSPPASKKPRADSPLIQVWLRNSSIKSFQALLTITFQLADHALTKSSDRPNITIPASTSLPLVPVGSNFDEINLKQVSIPLLSRFHNIFCPHQPS